MKYKIKQQQCFVVHGWMYFLGLADLSEIIVYAIIYGFSQDNDSEFKGSISYIQEWLQCSKPTAISKISKLVERGLVVKRKEVINDVTFNRYSAVVPDFIGSKESLQGVKFFNQGSKEFLPGGGKEILPNNNRYNNKEDININPSYIPPTEASLFEDEVSEAEVIEPLTFDEFWEAYNYKVGRKDAFKAWGKLSFDDKQNIKDNVHDYVSSTTTNKAERGKQFRCHPATYIRGERWNDVINTPTAQSGGANNEDRDRMAYELGERLRNL